MLVRKAAVAGSFYPGSAGEIKTMLQGILTKEDERIKRKLNPREVIGGIVPHAGFKYAAKEAVHFFNFLKESQEPLDTIIIINPSHTGASKEISFDIHERWNTPLGDVELDKNLMDFINLPKSNDSQQGEHSAEVILPYLQFFLDYEFKIVPIAMRKQSYKSARELAEMIFKANQVKKRKLAIIASSDFSHYVRPEVGFYNDNLVINRILNNSIRGLYDTINENKISVCGYGPIMTLMFYSRLLSANYNVEILARGNSAMDNKDDLVVDYVSMLFYN